MNNSSTPSWLLRLVDNLGVYLVFFAVGYLILKQVKKSPEPSPASRSCLPRFIRFMFYGPGDLLPQSEDEEADHEKTNGTPKKEMSFSQKAAQLMFCVVGLLGSFLAWGLLQERIMTTEYKPGRFKSANFNVFCSRSFGLVLAALVVRYTKQPTMKAPFYKYSFTSFSNVMSSYCQLEALKFLSFPVQVLGKSSKMIPVMLMGKIISKKEYPLYEYLVAIMILVGVGVFMISEKESSGEKSTSAAGIILLVGYLTFDSFTSQWQGWLFKEYKMSSYQMMLGVNSFSSLLTGLSLIQSGEMWSSIAFLKQDTDCMRDILLFSITGATGSMFIFHTIKTFGPLVFTMIMVTRQLIAIILSILFYGHPISLNGIFGAIIVFSSIGYRIYRKNSS
eukprot:snap_masked-scaffold_1-processed-gene-31.20-mRNA-1 protein AED:0.09 eAED:0.09 QI:0/-1/0/1/-1/1/1/0/390